MKFTFDFVFLVSGQMVACEVEELAEGMKVCLVFCSFCPVRTSSQIAKKNVLKPQTKEHFYNFPLWYMFLQELKSDLGAFRSLKSQDPNDKFSLAVKVSQFRISFSLSAFI